MNMMIAGKTEIKNLFPQDSANPSWERSTLPVDQAIEWTKVRVYVYSESSAMHVKINLIPKMQSKNGKGKRQPYRWSILSENYNGEPIAFEWQIFAGTTASEILKKKSTRILKDNASDLRVSVIEQSSCPCSTTSIWRRKGTKTLGYYQFEKNQKCMRQDSLTDTGYSWVQEKKASGIKDMQSIVASGNSVLHQLWRNSRIFGNPVLNGASPLGRGTLKMVSGRNTSHLNREFDNIDFLFRTVHAANQLCIYGAVTMLCEKQPEEDSGKASKGRPESARRTPREIQIKQVERKSLVDIPRLPPASGNRMLQNLENFELMPFMSKIESLRAAAKFYHQIETEENYYVTTLLEDDGWGRRTSMCKEYTAPRNQ